MKNYLAIITLMLALCMAPQMSRAQCPMCKAAVTSGAKGKDSKMVAGLNAGILYLFLLPYGSLMLLGIVIAVNQRKRKRNGQELSDTSVEDVIGDHQAGGQQTLE